MMRLAQKHLRGQVPAQLAAQGALDRDRLERELPDAGRHIAAAPFAGDDELSPLDGWESKGHETSVGEEEANMQGRLHIHIRVDESLFSQGEPALLMSLLGLAQIQKCSTSS